MVGQIFVDQMEVIFCYYVFELGCFVINVIGWFSDEQIVVIEFDFQVQKVLCGGCCIVIVLFEGKLLVEFLCSGEGILVVDFDMELVIKCKCMMDLVGYYVCLELLYLVIDDCCMFFMFLLFLVEQFVFVFYFFVRFFYVDSCYLVVFLVFEL